ncbi:hypothetical protein C0993_001581 [Termitomyces sp. T159_Od127]|nr:hypothetical protein C0993_001581 [Termitomyces sp. T159_Od127]
MPSIIKIPFILATTYAITASFTNPNPVIKNKERRPEESKTFVHLIVKYMLYFTSMFWLAAAAEIAVILLAERNLVSRELTTQALRILMPSNEATNLRLTPLSITGALLVVGGSALRCKCFHILQELFTFEMTLRENHRLISHGPYRYVRHPSYTGFVFAFVGMCCWVASSGSWVRESGVLGTMPGKVVVLGFMAVYIKLVVIAFQRMPIEDELMKASFGKEWEDWARRVPSWLVPGVY